ncbi:MAG: hypothetical protein Kow0031_14670 [Anaerolineae bacterium]
MAADDPRWRGFWQNLLWFLATMVALMVLFRWYPQPVFMLAMWLVGLGWGGWLAYRLGQLLSGDGRAEASRHRMSAAVAQARDYRAKISAAIEDGPAFNAVRTAELQQQIERLTGAIEDLSGRVMSLRGDDTIERDRQAVPGAIAKLEKQLAAETDPALRHQLELTLRNRQTQLDSLLALESTIKRAEIQIESTLSQLGTLYSQVLTSQSTSDVADYNHLTANVDEEVRLLEDQLEALREVKLGLE